MSRFHGKMRCGCGNNVFSVQDVVFTNEDSPKLNPCGDKILVCLICHKNHLHEGEGTVLYPITQEEGKTKIRSMKSRKLSDEAVVKEFLTTPKTDKKTKKESTNA